MVVEGPSAAGKTSWVSAQSLKGVLAEASGIEVPDGLAPTGLAEFWNELNCRRWAEAVEIETTNGLVICDTDPLKLHYDYCLARVGAGSWDRFETGVVLATDAIEKKRLGLADLVLVSIPDDESLRRQRNSDTTRSRRNFELHRRLSPGLRDWYSILELLDPGRVHWGFPDSVPEPVGRDNYDAALFRSWMKQLPRATTTA